MDIIAWRLIKYEGKKKRIEWATFSLTSSSYKPSTWRLQGIASAPRKQCARHAKIQPQREIFVAIPEEISQWRSLSAWIVRAFWIILSRNQLSPMIMFTTQILRLLSLSLSLSLSLVCTTTLLNAVQVDHLFSIAGAGLGVSVYVWSGFRCVRTPVHRHIIDRPQALVWRCASAFWRQRESCMPEPTARWARSWSLLWR